MSKHAWPDKSEWQVVLAQECRDGNEKIIRQCVACHLVKETVIPGFPIQPWHEWITCSGTRWIGEATPPCISKQPTEVVSG